MQSQQRITDLPMPPPEFVAAITTPRGMPMAAALEQMERLGFMFYWDGNRVRFRMPPEGDYVKIATQFCNWVRKPARYRRLEAILRFRDNVLDGPDERYN